MAMLFQIPATQTTDNTYRTFIEALQNHVWGQILVHVELTGIVTSIFVFIIQ